jgi:hypothetical protein
VFALALFSVSLFASTLHGHDITGKSSTETVLRGKGKDEAEQKKLEAFIERKRIEVEKHDKEQREEYLRVQAMREEEATNAMKRQQKTGSDENQNKIVSTGKDLAPADDVSGVHIKETSDLLAKRKNELEHFLAHKDTGAFDLHFIHIPKCGGTSMTGILRQVACQNDKIRNDDCCTNPGFCDFHAHRRCASIRGCINHIPQRPWIYKQPPSIALLRDPMSRLLSAWFYNCHSPNSDCYQVRPEFKLIKQGLAPKVQFYEYLDMPEYHNIQTRMLGGDSFPYKNYTVTRETFDAAVDALENLFFVGLQEAYDVSVTMLLRELHADHDIKIVKERDNNKQKSIKQAKADILNNATAVAIIKERNYWDNELYRVATERFCQTIREHPDLLPQLSTTKVKCPK